MGCGWFKSSSNLDNKRKSSMQQRDSRIITKNENSAPPIQILEVSASSEKPSSKKNKAEKTKDKSKKRNVKPKQKLKTK